MGDAPVKVVHLITLLEFGGAQGNTLHTVKNLDPRRFDAQLWCGKGAYWDKEAVNIRFFPALVRQVNPLLDFIALFQLWQAFRSFRPQILHTHSSKAGILGRLAGKLAGVPVIIHTFHGFGFNDRQAPGIRWFFVQLEKVIAGLADRLIFVSMANWREAEALGIGKKDKYVLIRSGVPLNSLRETAQKTDPAWLHKQFHLPAGTRVVTTIGAFKPQKNLFDFLRMAKTVAARFPQIHFFVIGDGALRPALEGQIREWGLSDRVHMPGWREDAVAFLAVSDVFVMTSLWEGLPRALVEAMVLGVPSVCYRTDGVSDLLKVEGGSVVERGDVANLSESVLDLLNNKEKHARLSASLKSRIGEEFDIDHMVDQQEDLYDTLLKVDNPRRKH